MGGSDPWTGSQSNAMYDSDCFEFSTAIVRVPGELEAP